MPFIFTRKQPEVIGGVLFGTAGIAILSSKDAKKAYTHCTAAVRTVIKSVPFIIKAVKSLSTGKLKVEALDGLAITASIIRGDFSTASSVMFLLETGEILEEWTRKKSVGDLARSMSLNVDKVWLVTDSGEVQVGIHTVKAGDRIVVRNSDIIPLDGTVIEGLHDDR